MESESLQQQQAATIVDPESVKPNFQAGMSEYEKRKARAARFGLDASKMIGPQASELPLIKPEMDPNQAFDQMQRGKHIITVEKKLNQIDKIKARAERFGDMVEEQSTQRIHDLEGHIDRLKNMEKPEEIREGAKIIENSLYLYGTDFMSTANIKMYIGTQFPNVQISWINDSSCTLQFESNEVTQEAYAQFSVRPATFQATAQPEDTTATPANEQSAASATGVENQDAGEKPAAEADQQEKVQSSMQNLDQRNFDSRIGWREALGYQIPKKGWQNLWIRFATDLDIKKEDTKGQNSRFYKYQQREKDMRQRNIGKHSKMRRDRYSATGRKGPKKALMGEEPKEDATCNDKPVAEENAEMADSDPHEKDNAPIETADRQEQQPSPMEETKQQQ